MMICLRYCFVGGVGVLPGASIVQLKLIQRVFPVRLADQNKITGVTAADLLRAIPAKVGTDFASGIASQQ